MMPGRGGTSTVLEPVTGVLAPPSWLPRQSAVAVALPVHNCGQLPVRGVERSRRTPPAVAVQDRPWVVCSHGSPHEFSGGGAVVRLPRAGIPVDRHGSDAKPSKVRVHCWRHGRPSSATGRTCPGRVFRYRAVPWCDYGGGCYVEWTAEEVVVASRLQMLPPSNPAAFVAESVSTPHENNRRVLPSSTTVWGTYKVPNPEPGRLRGGLTSQEEGGVKPWPVARLSSSPSFAQGCDQHVPGIAVGIGEHPRYRRLLPANCYHRIVRTSGGQVQARPAGC